MRTRSEWIVPQLFAIFNSFPFKCNDNLNVYHPPCFSAIAFCLWVVGIICKSNAAEFTLNHIPNTHIRDCWMNHNVSASQPTARSRCWIDPNATLLPTKSLYDLGFAKFTLHMYIYIFAIWCESYIGNVYTFWFDVICWWCSRLCWNAFDVRLSLIRFGCICVWM